jgi:uncharacterized protein
LQSSTIDKWSNWSLLAALTVLPLVCYLACLVQFGTAYVEGWLPSNSPVRSEYRKFVRDFGADQYLFVSWLGCRVEDPRLERMASTLRQLAQEQPSLSILTVRDSRSAVNAMVAQRLGTGDRNAQQLLRGYSLGEDGTAYILIQLGDASIAQRSVLITEIEARCMAIGVPAAELVLAGEPYQVHMIDRSSRETMEYFVAPSSILALGFAWICLRNLRLTILVFAFSGIGQVIGLALISLFFGEMSAVMVVLPTLIFMLTLSAAVHLTNYFKDVGGMAETASGVRAIRIGAWPCGLATMTTVFGFASLTVSQLSPVWQFGVLAALGLILSTSLLLSAFPAATKIVQWSNATNYAALATPRVTSNQSVPPSSQPKAWQSGLAKFNQRFSLPICCTGILVLIWSAFGVLRMRTSTEFVDMFPPENRAIRNLQWIEERLGPIDSVEILVNFRDADALPLLDRMRIIQRVEADLQSLDSVYRVLSAATFLPEISDRKGTRSVIQRAVLRRSLLDNYAAFVTQGLLHRDGEVESWRMTVRLGALNSDEFELTRDALLRCVEESVNRFPISQDVDIRLTGLRTVVEMAHKTLLRDLGGSFATAFLLITPVMMWISRGLLSGVILMIPNVLPVLLVFGGMGWLGIRLDVASILTASVALGIAVDDTLHFMSWYFRCCSCGQSRVDAAMSAMMACARPMLHTTVICAGAMLPFFFSDFLPTSKFALLMILILSGAILGDLILLPAILMSPFGRMLGTPTRRNLPT